MGVGAGRDVLRLPQFFCRMEGRIMAIDYGARRCGIAVTDSLRLSVNPLPFVPTAELMSFLERYFRNETVGIVVLGESRHADGQANDIQKAIEGFAERLARQFGGLEVVFQDESGSSREAMQHMLHTGVGRKKRSDKGTLDSVSAGIILERYLRASGIW